MSSWSENRSSGGQKPKASAVRERIRQVNAVLAKLADDQDFQERLELPIVKKALLHWTNQNRLPPKEAQFLQDSRDVIYVLQRFQMVQSVCREALLPVPLDLLLSGTKTLPQTIVDSLLLDAEPEPEPPKPKVTTTTKKEKAAATSAAAAEKLHNPPAATSSAAPSQTATAAAGAGQASTTASTTASAALSPAAAYDPNTTRWLLAVVIAVVAVLTTLFRKYLAPSP